MIKKRRNKVHFRETDIILYNNNKYYVNDIIKNKNGDFLGYIEKILKNFRKLSENEYLIYVYDVDNLYYLNDIYNSDIEILSNIKN